VRQLARLGVWLVPVALALGVAALLMWGVGASPWQAFRLLVEGSVGSRSDLADTLLAWAPLALAATGLVITFTAGLWNIGVEGQLVAGAIGASFVAREVSGPKPVVIILALLGGALAGALWAGLAAWLKVQGKVNEIFGGLGLTFVIQAFTTYLVIGPWKRAGVASTGGTDPFPERAWLPVVGSSAWSPVAIALAVAAVVAVWLALRGTRFGLRLKAVGQGPDSARMLGIPNRGYLYAAFLLGGALAGLAGSIQAIGFQHKLVPGISGGRGYLAILVALLAAFQAKWIAPIALFFAAVSVGQSQLPLVMQLDSSVGGILRSVLVLFVLFFGAWQQTRTRSNPEAGP
jgi:simple sugar transport system permease protein